MLSRSGLTRARSERGQIGTWLSLTVAFVILGLGVLYFTRISKGVDEAAGIQAGADAAALAGAQSIGRDAPGRLVSALESGHGFPPGMGNGEADDFARRNGTYVTDYSYDPVRDRIEVTVKSLKVTETGSRETAHAVAKLGVRLGPCSMPTVPPRPTPAPPTPTPTPTDGSTPTPTPTPTPPDTTLTGHCGDIDVKVTFPGSGGAPIFHWNAAALKSAIEPRLVD